MTDDLEEQEEENEEESKEDHEIPLRKAKRAVMYTDKEDATKAFINRSDSDKVEEGSLIRYSQKLDFCRDLIKESMHVQRHKTITWEMIQENMHLPFFLDQMDNTFFFDGHWIKQILIMGSQLVVNKV